MAGRTKIDCAAIQGLFEGLLGRPAVCNPSKPTMVLGKQQWVIGVHHDDEDKLAGLSISYTKLANYVGAALSMVPSTEAEQGARAGTVSGELLLNFREILNVGANLFPSGGGLPVRIVDVVMARPKLDPVFVKLLRKAKSRIDALVNVDG